LIVPFTRKPAEPDPTLEAKLRDEWPGILRWAIDGAVDWHRNGLARPSSVTEATRAYFDDEDVFGQWLVEECDLEPGNDKMEKSATLYDAWKAYALKAGEPTITARQFNDRMRQRGLEHKQIKALGTKGFRGIRLKLAGSYLDGSAA
jgi:putative DNA primase/helicase